MICDTRNNTKMNKLLVSFIFFSLYCVSNEILNQSLTPLTSKCIGCICEAISQCDRSGACAGDVCGAFRITWGYWADGGKPTVNSQNPEEASAYSNCAADLQCSSFAVQGYMKKYAQDCTGDGKVDCDDYAAIHKLGGYGCRAPLPDFYAQRYKQCKDYIGNLNEA